MDYLIENKNKVEIMNSRIEGINRGMKLKIVSAPGIKQKSTGK